jgi:hypothetical protein
MEERMTDFTPEALRARFAALTEQRDTVAAVSEPLRTRRDAIAAQAAADLAALDVEIRAAETGLFDLDQERAMIARALGGRTGID